MKTLFLKRAHKGFTLIELLLVIGIIAILASIVIVAINPTKQLADARNAQRKADVNTILNAVYQWSIDKSQLPNGITTSRTGALIPLVATDICKTKKPSDSSLFTPANCIAANALYWSPWFLTGAYIVSPPTDPSFAANESITGYRIERTNTNRIKITTAAPVENGVTISAER